MQETLRIAWRKRGRADGRRMMVLAAVITPFADGVLDESSFEENIRFLEFSGADGCLIAGTTGENAVLTEAERDREIVVARRVLAPGSIVLCGTKRTTRTVDAAVAETAVFSRLGVDAALVAPLSDPADQADETRVVEEIAAVARSASVPVVFYHPPTYAKRPLSEGAIAAIRDIPELAGVKDSTGHDRFVEVWAERSAPDFGVFVGSSRIFRALAAAPKSPATGGIMALAGLCPSAYLDLQRLRADGLDVGAIDAAIARRESVVQAGGIPALKALYEDEGLFGGESTPSR